MNGFFTTKSAQTSHGFSLIELMVVISIVAIVVSMGSAIFKNYVSRAKETEGALNVRGIVTLAQAYYMGDEDRISSVGQIINLLSQNNYSTETSCYQTAFNPIGFRPTFCRKLNYVYGISTANHAGSPKTFGAFALEGSEGGVKRIYPRCNGTSFWTGDVGGVRHTISPFKTSDCMTCFNTAVAASAGNINFDINGNGNVGGAADVEITSIVPAVIFSPYGTGMNHLNTCPF